MTDLRLELQLSRDTFSNEIEKPQKNRKIRAASSTVASTEMKPLDSNWDASGRPLRHQHETKKQVHQLRLHVKTVMVQQDRLQQQVREMNKAQISTMSNLQKVEEELRALLKTEMKKKNEYETRNGDVDELSWSERLGAVEKEQRDMKETLQNVSFRVTGIDKIQSSTLQLFEALETLEDKYDANLSDVQKEIARLENNHVQVASTVEVVKEEQCGERSSSRCPGLSASKLCKKSIFPSETQASSRIPLVNVVQQTLEIQPDTHKQQSALVNAQPLQQAEANSIQHRLELVEKRYNKIARMLPRDCRNASVSGVVVIVPGGSTEPLEVACDMETAGGGWTVIQRRLDGKEDFHRDWNDYQHGFGNPAGEFWIGNDAMHLLTGDNSSSLRVDLWDVYGQYWWAEYEHFSVGLPADGYELSVGSYRGNASDALLYHHGMKFSTKDRDQDSSNTNCADSYQGGWWYSHCQHVNVNGKYSLGLTWYDSLENEWIAVAKVEMKIKDRRNFH
nr:EOG090X02LG [Lepidurus arcticus]